jgi:hypothetical protein
MGLQNQYLVISYLAGQALSPYVICGLDLQKQYFIGTASHLYTQFTYLSLKVV